TIVPVRHAMGAVFAEQTMTKIRTIAYNCTV
ncbi:hypothetical protein AC249_AIPGENE1803, partial [Exaiptasia diaphana]